MLANSKPAIFLNLNMPILNYTTKIDPDKTCAEIGRILSSHGAQAVMTEYDQENHLVSALSFKIDLGEKKIAFRLPADWRPVQRVLREQRIKADQAMAVRVSWRILRDWVLAQMALFEAKQIAIPQLLLGFAMANKDKTVYQVIQEKGLFLGSGEK